ncbi:choice-of-anchor P family protein [Actinokineospora pegani]|uniref:choice-of-anchor P family protein n=1 Tax=Actinokineospora pegani TaxID=2654637 RepID=UPI0012EAA072|nr:choice-of-anchor P family protein [Actinokineospora pegani]
MHRSRALALACTIAGSAALTALTAPLAVAEGGPKGSAFALSIQAQGLGVAQVQLGPVPQATYPAGGDKSLVKADLDKLGVHAKVINAESTLTGGVLTSAASIADVDLMGILKAEVVSATCTTEGGKTTGKSTLAGVTLLGHKIDVAARGKINVADLATVVLDEQVTAEDGTLTVNALRVSFLGGKLKQLGAGEIILSQATCSGGTGNGGGGGDDDTNPTTTPTTTKGDTPDTDGPGDTPDSTDTPSSTDPSTTTAPGDGSGAPTTSTPAITPVANDGDLASTGASGILPMTLGGVALLGAGAGAFWYSRRKRTTA